MHQRYDRGSKWLIDRHPDALLRVAGVPGVASARALASELVQPRQLPDGLIEATIEGRPAPVLHLIEINTYPDNRVPDELLDDVVLTYLRRRQVPEVVTLVLHPKHNLRVNPNLSVASELGGTELTARWRVVELWTVPAEPFLAAGDPGLVPWLTLMHFDGEPGPFLRRCEQVIEERAAAGEQEQLRVVSRVLGGLRFDDQLLAAIFTEGGPMLDLSESSAVKPLLERTSREERRAAILETLEVRFGSVPEPTARAVRAIDDLELLRRLRGSALRVSTLVEFEQALPR